MGPRSLGLRIALVAVPMAAVIAAYDDGGRCSFGH